MMKAGLLRRRAYHVSRVFLTGLCAASVLFFARQSRATSWGEIEPLKSRRADVERVLGKPVEDKPGATGTLRFKVQGGMVQVAFVDERFVRAHKLFPEMEGTVRQVVLQHEGSSETPDTMKLANNSSFERDPQGNAVIFRNLRDGLSYTFIEGRLRTTYYTASAEQFRRAQKGTADKDE
jgi:hypothetical protein